MVIFYIIYVTCTPQDQSKSTKNASTFTSIRIAIDSQLTIIVFSHFINTIPELSFSKIKANTQQVKLSNLTQLATKSLTKFLVTHLE